LTADIKTTGFAFRKPSLRGHLSVLAVKTAHLAHLLAAVNIRSFWVCPTITFLIKPSRGPALISTETVPMGTSLEKVE
jgi:hypothetical protein